MLLFANISNDPENEYFADGLSEEIFNVLADVPDLRVTARTSSFQFKDQNLDIREVAADLENAVRCARSPEVRALMEVGRVLVSPSWREVPRRMQEALAGTTCDEGTWIEVAPVFGLAEAFLERSRRMIECDPLNFYRYFTEGTALLWLDQPAAAYEATQRGLARTPGHPFLRLSGS